MTAVYDSNNIFAKILRGEIPNHTVYEDDKTLAFMDVMPQARGHVLVVPKTEAVELSDLPLDYAQAVMATAQKVMAAQRQVLQRQGIVQMQLNHAQAGQSVFHYHMHLIPSNIHELGRHEGGMADHGELAELAAELRAVLAG
ncbi:histidine triad (HIT) family protein [Neisseria sp. HSC-16F19]|nr:HIT domain-containing protein [Neisseria sp. HSC-16F19]MCP2039890.1 histidine triad (HIT) family protein [Neisseria sp. HSC-16F19]